MLFSAFLEIPVALPEREDACGGQHEGHYLCDRRGKPDSRCAYERWQDEHECALADERPEKGDDSGDEAVAQRGEQDGPEEVEADEDEGDGVDAQAIIG